MENSNASADITFEAKKSIREYLEETGATQQIALMNKHAKDLFDRCTDLTEKRALRKLFAETSVERMVFFIPKSNMLTVEEAVSLLRKGISLAQRDSGFRIVERNGDFIPFFGEQEIDQRFWKNQQYPCILQKRDYAQMFEQAKRVKDILREELAPDNVEFNQRKYEIGKEVHGRLTVEHSKDMMPQEFYKDGVLEIDEESSVIPSQHKKTIDIALSPLGRESIEAQFKGEVPSRFYAPTVSVRKKIVEVFLLDMSKSMWVNDLYKMASLSCAVAIESNRNKYEDYTPIILPFSDDIHGELEDLKIFLTPDNGSTATHKALRYAIDMLRNYDDALYFKQIQLLSDMEMDDQAATLNVARLLPKHNIKYTQILFGKEVMRGWKFLAERTIEDTRGQKTDPEEGTSPFQDFLTKATNIAAAALGNHIVQWCPRLTPSSIISMTDAMLGENVYTSIDDELSFDFSSGPADSTVRFTAEAS